MDTYPFGVQVGGKCLDDRARLVSDREHMETVRGMGRDPDALEEFTQCVLPETCQCRLGISAKASEPFHELVVREGIGYVAAPATSRLKLDSNTGELLAQQHICAFIGCRNGGHYAGWSAANDGNANAQFYVGGLYRDGAGVSASLPQAHFWWLLASENGHATATRFLGELRAEMLPHELVAADQLIKDWNERIKDGASE